MWQKLHLVLCLLMIVVTVVRLATGHVFGAIFAAILAVVFGAIAFDYPLLPRLRRARQLLRRVLRL